MPENTVSVCRPGKWGNPFRVGDMEFVAGGPARPMDAERVVSRYRFWLTKDLGARHLRSCLPELRGKNLACYCKPGTPCHADVLLDLANEPVIARRPDDGGQPATPTESES